MTAHKCEGPGYHPEAHAEHQTTDTRDCASQPDDVQAADKLKSTTFAQAAMVGLAVYELSDGTYLATRWGLITRPLPDLAAVRALVRQMGGQL